MRHMMEVRINGRPVQSIELKPTKPVPEVKAAEPPKVLDKKITKE